MKVSLFEITYKKKLTFSRHSNLLRCTCNSFACETELSSLTVVLNKISRVCRHHVSAYVTWCQKCVMPTEKKTEETC